MKPAREVVEKYYWMTCYPNADYNEFKKSWLSRSDNEAFVAGFTALIEARDREVREDERGRMGKMLHHLINQAVTFGVSTEDVQIDYSNLTTPSKEMKALLSPRKGE